MSERPSRADMPIFDGKEVSLLDLLIVIAKYKRTIAAVVILAASFSAIVSLLLPNVYTGTTKLLPPEQRQSSASLLLGQLSGLAGIAANSLSIKNPNDLYVGMLKSRTIADNIIRQFDLQRLYEKETLTETRIELASNTTITSGKDGLITIEFDDIDPNRAAAIANAYVSELDKLTQSLAVTEAAQRRLFFERQLKQAREDLSAAEVSLKATQERTGLIELTQQGRALLEALAAIRGQISAKEVELRSLATFATRQNSDYVRVKEELVALRAELDKLEKARSLEARNGILPKDSLPEAGLEYLRRLRDVKYYETIFELIAKQFEAAKIDEAREAAIIQVVDTAIAPDRKTRPKRALIVVVATITAMFATIVWVFWLELSKRAQLDPVHAARISKLRHYLT